MGVIFMGLCCARVSIVVLLLSTCLAEAAEYQYPFHNPYLATATIALLGDDSDTPRGNSRIVHVPGLPGRNNLPGVQGRGDLSVAFYRQNGPAPLLFILPGLGATPFFGVAPYLANLFYRAGSHVVILPSPMSWNFALAASRSGVPGYVPQDARDLYEVMQKTLALLRERHDVRPTAVHFLGFSLGALQGAYLSVLDADEGKLGIAKYLLINPPVDLDYAVDKIDEWGRLGRKFGPDKAQRVISEALAIVDSFADAKLNDPTVFDRFVKQFSRFSTEELQFLIAENLQSQLNELVYATQVINDQGLLSAPKNDVRRRLEEARRFTLADYHEKIAVPVWRKHAGSAQATRQSFQQESALSHVIDRLRTNPKVHILHNADDFLVPRKSLEALKETLGSQITVHPYGGHLGNLWWPENKKFFLNYFATPTANAAR
jgi:hypothetical protein